MVSLTSLFELPIFCIQGDCFLKGADAFIESEPASTTAENEVVGHTCCCFARIPCTMNSRSNCNSNLLFAYMLGISSTIKSLTGGSWGL